MPCDRRHPAGRGTGGIPSTTRSRRWPRRSPAGDGRTVRQMSRLRHKGNSDWHTAVPEGWAGGPMPHGEAVQPSVRRPRPCASAHGLVLRDCRASARQDSRRVSMPASSRCMSADMIIHPLERGIGEQHIGRLPGWLPGGEISLRGSARQAWQHGRQPAWRENCQHR